MEKTFLKVNERFKSFDDYSKDKNILVSTTDRNNFIGVVLTKEENINEHINNINIILKEYCNKDNDFKVVEVMEYKNDGRNLILTNLPWTVYVKNMTPEEIEEHKMREYGYSIKDWNITSKRMKMNNMIEHLQVENLKDTGFYFCSVYVQTTPSGMLNWNVEEYNLVDNGDQFIVEINPDSDWWKENKKNYIENVPNEELHNQITELCNKCLKEYLENRNGDCD